MSKFWPEDGEEEGVFDGILSAGDPCPDEVIRDKYGLIKYAAHVWLASSPRFAGLAMNGLALFRLADPEEYRKVQGLARRCVEARRRSEKLIPGSPDWLILDMHVLDPAEEQAALDRVGLTKAEVLALIPS